MSLKLSLPTVKKSQRQYDLSRKIKAIQEKLASFKEAGFIDEQHQLFKKLEKAEMPLKTKEKVMLKIESINNNFC